MYVLLTQHSSDTIGHVSANPGFIPKPIALPLQENTVCLSVPLTHKLFPLYSTAGKVYYALKCGIPLKNIPSVYTTM